MHQRFKSNRIFVDKSNEYGCVLYKIGAFGIYPKDQHGKDKKGGNHDDHD